MSASTTALHVFGNTFRKLAEEATAGAVTIRVFASNTLGQEREVVQQLQEGLVDFMVSGTAIWGSVAPKLQVFDFPFMWATGITSKCRRRPRGREAADYLGGRRPMRPRLGRLLRFQACDHAVARRHGDDHSPASRSDHIRPIYVKAVELMGPARRDGLRRSLQTRCRPA